MPTLRDPDLLVYYRPEVGGLVMGGYERDSAAFATSPTGFDAVPSDFNGRLLKEDWRRFEEMAPEADGCGSTMRLLPGSASVE